MGFLDFMRGAFRRAPGAVREDMMFVGRARLITHLCDEWGEEGCSEVAFDPKPPGFDPLLVFEFAPAGDRNFWTYATAGLSLCPAMDAHPPTELIAYSETRAEGLVDLLYQLAFKENPTEPYRAGDIASFDADPPDLGIPLGRDYGLLSAPERPALTNFPDPTVRPEDERHVMARPGEDGARVQFLRVVALADADRPRWNAVRTDLEATRAWRLF